MAKENKTLSTHLGGILTATRGRHAPGSRTCVVMMMLLAFGSQATLPAAAAAAAAAELPADSAVASGA